MAWLSVEIEVEGESYRTPPPVVLGRSRGAGSQDVLAVKTPDEKELYVFKGVYARWGCAGNDTDCASRRQLEIAVEGDVVVVKNVGRASAYSQGRPIDSVILRPGQQLELTLPGVYTHDGRKARIVIKALGAEPPMQPAADTLCTAFCEAWQIIRQLYDLAKDRPLITTKQAEDLEHLLNIFKGHFNSLEKIVARVNPDFVRELVSIRELVELLLPQLRQGGLSQAVDKIVSMHNEMNHLRQMLSCRC